MTEQDFADIISRVVKSGVDVTMTYDGETVWYDMNTKMKSDLRIALVNNTCVAKGRYETRTLEDFDDLLIAVKDCQCGRDFFNPSWLTLLPSLKEST